MSDVDDRRQQQVDPPDIDRRVGESERRKDHMKHLVVIASASTLHNNAAMYGEVTEHVRDKHGCVLQVITLDDPKIDLNIPEDSGLVCLSHYDRADEEAQIFEIAKRFRNRDAYMLNLVSNRGMPKCYKEHVAIADVDLSREQRHARRNRDKAVEPEITTPAILIKMIDYYFKSIQKPEDSRPNQGEAA